ncbi:ABC transporter substrate-binding protein [Aneurinibacillus sp. Ricciae_BoGa-3]|uniref:ABC transporter substrate-binding protein n=1 Tax=Aneurinibacillus sp. Ricciae_BoGa-3 TaxID=3022697 RepID=UPI0023400CE0|nr:ABC transporter substrate-binding protein [Aneurinibacillus sp. Ricciae_BoGa-3]WCK54903.1 ABC transporter substrate-binding protein [Aneurinibacillus sp. Ricciae_BoGa-3]
MKKAILSIFSSVLVAGTMLAGCAPAGQQGSQSGSAGSANGPTTINFWYAMSGKNGEVVKKMVDDFNHSQKEVQVNASFQGDYYANHAKVLSAIAAGNQPDVTQIEVASMASFADKGALEDLTPYLTGKNGTDQKDFVPGLLGNSYWNNKLYGIPFNRSTPLLYINKDKLKAAGLDPNGPKTWDELRTYSQKLSKKGQEWGFSTPIDIWFYEAMVFENGGKILSQDGKQALVDTPQGIAPIAYWKDMIAEGSMKMPPGAKYDAWEAADNDFINGKAAMIFDSTGSLNMLLDKAKFNVGTAFLPKKDNYGVAAGGANLVMLAKSQKKDAAWKFIKYMTDKEQTIKVSEQTGYMPVRQSAIDSPEMKQFFTQHPQFKVAVDQLKHAQPRPASPGYKELQEVIMNDVQKAILGQASPADALKDAADKGTQLLQR